MPKVTIVVGLCGSGKSYHCDQIKAKTGAKHFEHVASQEGTRAGLIEHLRQGKDATVEDCTYCNPAAQREIEKELRSHAIDGLVIEWHAFENNLRQANLNCMKRPPKGPNEGSLDADLDNNAKNTPIYKYPPGAEILKIHPL